MMKGITALLLFMTVAGTASAGSENFAAVEAGTAPPGQRGNSIAPPVIAEKYEYYEVCGCCEKDLQCDLKQKCIRWNDGKKYDSVTNWKITWDYDHNPGGQSCTPDSFRVTVDVIFHLPKWVPTKEAPRRLVDKWDGYMRSLLTHEKGHRDIAVKAAAELSRKVAQLPSVLACSELEREIHDLSRKQMRILDGDEKRYDAETGHGYTQGAIFP